VICGDNYFAQDIEKATREVMGLIEPFRPDAVIAGPAFFAGRYAVACGAVCKAAGEKIGVPAVTGMYRENPAVDLYGKDVYIVQTGQNAKDMGWSSPRWWISPRVWLPARRSADPPMKAISPGDPRQRKEGPKLCRKACVHAPCQGEGRAFQHRGAPP